MNSMDQALIFKLDNCEYAVNSDSLIKIIRIPELTKISYVHNAMLGLCTTEGQIIPVLDGLQLVESNSNGSCIDIDGFKTRALIIKHKDLLMAIVVEEVVQNIDIIEKDVEFIDDSMDAVIGFMKSGDNVVQILSIDKMVSNVKMPELQRHKKRVNSKTETILDNNLSQNFKQYLVFNMGEEKFGIFIDTVREIIVDSNKVIPIVNAPKEVLGLITLRNEILAVVDLRIYFKKPIKKSDKNRILVVRVENFYMGVLVDSIYDIVDIYDHEIEVLPEKFRDEKVSGIAKQEKNLTTVLSDAYLKTIAKSIKSYVQDAQIKKSDEHYKREFEEVYEVAIFLLGDEEFAINIEDVHEIIRYTGCTKVPSSQEYILGIINLRGEVIPIVSLNKKLGYEEYIKDDSKILISDIYDSKIGFLVNDVSDIKEINVHQIKKNDDENIFSHTILLDNGERMVLKMALKNFFKKNELLGLAEEEAV